MSVSGSGRNPAGTALVPVEGSVPFEQSTPVLRMTIPVAFTLKKHGDTKSTLLTRAIKLPVHVPIGMIVRWVASIYFFSARTANWHAAPTTSGASPEGAIGTSFTSVVPVGQLPVDVVPI